jgi:hypothetical protein
MLVHLGCQQPKPNPHRCLNWCVTCVPPACKPGSIGPVQAGVEEEARGPKHHRTGTRHCNTYTQNYQGDVASNWWVGCGCQCWWAVACGGFTVGSCQPVHSSHRCRSSFFHAHPAKCNALHCIWPGLQFVWRTGGTAAPCHSCDPEVCQCCTSPIHPHPPCAVSDLCMH